MPRRPSPDDFISHRADTRTVTRGLHIGFGARSPAQSGAPAGRASGGPPRRRASPPRHVRGLLRRFLLDPDGNSGGGPPRRNPPARHIDHLWIRVADVPAAAAFYDLVAPYGGFVRRGDDPDHAHFVGAGGSFSLVAGTPTEHVHIAFPATENATVDAFHRAAIEAGYRDNGPPGERPRYHPGYYGAYVRSRCQQRRDRQPQPLGDRTAGALGGADVGCRRRYTGRGRHDLLGAVAWSVAL
jgi:hypothetical protein